MSKNRFFQLLAVFAVATAGAQVASAAEDDITVEATATVEAYAHLTGSTGLDCGSINYNNANCDAGYTPATVTFDVQGSWELTLEDDATTSACSAPDAGVTVTHEISGDDFCITLEIEDATGTEGGEGLSRQVSATGLEALTADDDTGVYTGTFTVTLSAI